jgi:alpha-mannosidase
MFFTLEKLELNLKSIQNAIHRERREIPRFKYKETAFTENGRSPLSAGGPHCPDFDDCNWQDFTVGDTWGGYDRTAWFRTWLDIPAEWAGSKLALRFVVGPRDGGGSTAETLLFVNGQPMQGLDIWHEEAWLPPELTVQGRIFVALKAWSGVLKVPDMRRFKTAELIRIDEVCEGYFFLASNLLAAARCLDENDLRRVRLLELLDRSMHCVDFFQADSASFYSSVADAFDCLSQGMRTLPGGELKPKVTGVGHSHIDMAWLWRLDHTREKASRTFSTVLHLMRQYPEYRFMHSSPQLYKFLKEDYPEIYQQVCRRIAEGRWEVTGGMWVEADTNLTSGESLIRQFLFGRRFMREEFGAENNLLWLPDVFGYSAALPQIARKCGIEYFLTSKISWSQFNRFPNDTFLWRGIDGSELLTHFVTTPEENTWLYTYNGRLDASEVKGIWDNYRQKDLNDELLLLYGWGDGGGGPTREMLETARALNDVPGLPTVDLGLSEPYFARLQRRLQGKRLPVWDGELYLEYHRGTYTSQAQIKRANRQAEILYHDAEWIASLAGALALDDEYPADELSRGWERILLNQFHDILPGSSIRDVYQDSAQDYDRIFSTGKQVFERSTRMILEQISAPSPSLVVFNSLSWPRGGLVEIPSGSCMDLPVQPVIVNGEQRLLVEVPPVPALGYAAAACTSSSGEHSLPTGGSKKTDGGSQDDRSGPRPAAHLSESALAFPGLTLLDRSDAIREGLSVSTTLLENAYYSIRLNDRGQLVSLYDRSAGREVLSSGERGNVLQVFEDRPMNFDAWDIDIYYQEKMREVDNLVEAVVEESGPLRGVVRLCWRYGSSTITQRLTLYRSSPRIDFRTHVDWHERQVLLKAAFPVAVRSTRATYEIQFGSVERPTHWNTSWDYARFETPAHRWVDLSEGGYGVSLLNDCKYGHDIKENVMRLTLIKSAIDPDPTADQGEHTFTYSLLPHRGDWREGRVIEQAYDLNFPLHTGLIQQAQKGSLPSQFSLAECQAGHVIIETVKQAEDGEGWIFRVYETQQRRASNVHLSFPVPLSLALECNLVEEDDRPIAFDESGLWFDILPFEIKTFKVWF